MKSLSHVWLFATPIDCSLPGSSIHGIFQTRVLEWVAISFSRGSSWPRGGNQVSRIVGRCFTENTGLKLNIQKQWRPWHPVPIPSWQTDGEKEESGADFIFLSSRITVDGDYSHEIKRHLLFGRKAMANLDSVSKSRAITLSTKII